MVYSPNLEKHKVLFHEEKKNTEDATCYYTLFTVYLCSGENAICDLHNVSNRQSCTIKRHSYFEEKNIQIHPCLKTITIPCSAAKQYIEIETGCQLQIERKKNMKSGRDSTFSPVSPKGFCIYLNYPESEPFN